MTKIQYQSTSPAEQKADLLILPLYEGLEGGPGVREAGKAMDVDLLSLAREQGAKGKVGEAVTIPTLGRLPARTLMLLGLGARGKADPQTARTASGKVATRVVRFGDVATTVPQGGGRDWEEAIVAFLEGLLLGSYRFDRYKAQQNGDAPALGTVTVLGPSRWDARRARKAIERAQILAEATNWARDLVNTPAMDATPAFLAEEARKMGRSDGLKVKVWSKADLEKGGFGGILGVGRGSEHDPRLIEIRYQGGSGKPIGLSGKGVTFDSGGLSIKDSKGMEWMKADMAGAASILGAMRAIARLKPKVNVLAVIPSAENMPGSSAIRPGDVLTHRGGKTSEVLNTDAEGRLILADALAYLSEQEPSLIVDTATLTGACVIALGDDLWGVMGTDAALVKDLLAAGKAAGEPGWELPLWDGYQKHIESQVADVKNIGARGGGTITAALFLKAFVGDVPWAHMDIAGTAYAERPGPFWPKGATGSPVRTLVRFVEARAKRR
ncbi:MAG TPA: leucyl aminopeptidase [Actinomycetota bacterium]